MMHTTALWLGTTAGFACMFTNASNREVPVTVRFITMDGVVATASAADLTAGETHEHNWATRRETPCSASASSPAAPSTPAPRPASAA